MQQWRVVRGSSRRNGWLTALCVLTGIGLALALGQCRLGRQHEMTRAVVVAGAGETPVTVNHAAFLRWMQAKPERAAQVAAFERYLAAEGLAEIVPPWTLLRAEAKRSAQCHAEPFVLPPRALWPHIRPALRIVRARVIPAIGRVDVASTYRDPSLNGCAGGAGQSRHMQFAAIDLEPRAQPDVRSSFTRLCAAWRRYGPAEAWGLGAYYDPAHPTWSARGRFHVDGTGWRTWGFSKHSASSGCHVV